MTEHRVARVEVRLRRVGDEPLAAAGVLPVERHPHGSAQVRQLVQLVANRVARAAFAVAARVAALNDEVGHHAMDRDAVEEALVRQVDEVRHRQRRVGDRQLDLDRAAIGRDKRMR